MVVRVDVCSVQVEEVLLAFLDFLDQVKVVADFLAFVLWVFNSKVGDELSVLAADFLETDVRSP